MWRRFPSSLWFLLLNLVGHIKRCLHKNIGNILWFSFGDMTVPFQKTMYRHCDLDPWPMKVKLFLSIDYDPISVLYQIQSDMSTNSREIKYQNSEKSLSLIIEWLVSMATKKSTVSIFTTNFCHGSRTRMHRLSKSQDDRTSIEACTSFNYGQMETDRQTAVTNILCKNLRFCKVIRLNDVGSS